MDFDLAGTDSGAVTKSCYSVQKTGNRCIQASTIKGFSHCRDLSVDLAGDGDPLSMVGGFETGECKDHGYKTMKSKMTLSKALAGIKKGAKVSTTASLYMKGLEIYTP
jgi:hypothetical protein|uniref:Uncharacterized protein n=1 Tax=Eutreptiella gymnastica TaxID=73025 RepID=A0A7S4FTH6_9EUGL